MNWRLGLITSLAIFISSSSFDFQRYIIQSVEHGHVSDSLLNLAVELEVPAALHYAVKQQKKGSQQWLTLMQKLAKQSTDAATYLAQFYASSGQMQQSDFWHKQAIQKGDTAAIMAYSEQLFSQQKFTAVIQLLKYHQKDSRALNLLARSSIATGNIRYLESLYGQLQLSTENGELVAEIDRFQILTKDPKVVALCENSVQMFATNLVDLNHADHLIESAKSSRIGQQFCFETPAYITINELECERNPHTAISCDESVWQHYQSDIEAKYLALVLPSGGANVHFGIMYLDRHDTANVFRHELSHWLGFVDEYAMNAAHKDCQREQSEPFSNNIATLSVTWNGSRAEVRQKVLQQLPWRDFIDTATPILQRYNGGWKVGTPESFQDKVGVFKSETCNNTQVQAYRAITDNNLMSHTDMPFPMLYQHLYMNNNQYFSMPGHHFNLSLSEQK